MNQITNIQNGLKQLERLSEHGLAASQQALDEARILQQDILIACLEIDLAKLGERLIDRCREEGQKRVEAAEFQVLELERYEDEERSERRPG